MSSISEELNTELYHKVFEEQQKYKEWLLTLSPEEILCHTYEYTVREDIVLALEYHDVTDEQARALLSSPSPLMEIFRDFEQIEGDHMDIIRGCIETRAKDIIEAQAQELRELPVYSKSGAYAKEHGEREQYNKSMQANVMCRTAIEDAIQENYRDNRLNPAGAKSVLDRFGTERTCYVLAATVQDKDWDGRISDANKKWAKDFMVPQEKTSWNSDAYRRFVVSGAHPGLVDLFVKQVRRELDERDSSRGSVLKVLQEIKPAQMKKLVTNSKEVER